jgi:copper oxidase (laccase) domain-containing protein
VGHEVADAVVMATGKGTYVTTRGDSRYLDLAAANMIQARSAGVIPDNIWRSPDCTCCLPDKYYSYRFTKGVAGRQYGFIGII